jgi:hypothetical protein
MPANGERLRVDFVSNPDRSADIRFLHYVIEAGCSDIRGEASSAEHHRFTLRDSRTRIGRQDMCPSCLLLDGESVRLGQRGADACGGDDLEPALLAARQEI